MRFKYVTNTIVSLKGFEYSAMEDLLTQNIHEKM